MPTYEFLHSVDGCKHEWEEILSIKAPDPTHCPECGKEGNITRLVSGGSGKGKVELYGQELVDQCKSDAKKIMKEASQNANTYANLLGNDRYHQIQTQMDRRKR